MTLEIKTFIKMDSWEELGVLELLALTFLASAFWEEVFVSKFMPTFYNLAETR